MSSRTGLGNAVDVHEIPSCRSALKHVSARLAKLKSTVTVKETKRKRNVVAPFLESPPLVRCGRLEAPFRFLSPLRSRH